MLEPLFSRKFLVLSLIFGSILCDKDYEDFDFVFPGSTSRSGNVLPRSSSSEVSLTTRLEIAREFSQIETLEEFLQHVEGMPAGLNPAFNIESRFGSERANAEFPKPANCIPEMQAVSLKNTSSGPNTLYYPGCTRVPRCGGCCGHALFSCQPIQTETKNYQVYAVEYDPTKKLSYKSKLVVQVEEHVKCRCMCKKKAEDCNSRQTYVEAECSCACLNNDERTKCLNNNNTKYWDDDKCTCKCRDSHECSTGFSYDHASCGCKQISGAVRRRNTGDEISRNSPGHSSARKQPAYAIPLNDPRRKPKDDPE